MMLYSFPFPNKKRREVAEKVPWTFSMLDKNDITGFRGDPLLPPEVVRYF